MSLINSMLRDLDKRRAGDETRKGLPSIVRPLPAAKSNLAPVVMIALVLAVISGAIASWWHSRTEVATPAPMAAAPEPTPPPSPPLPTQIEPIALPVTVATIATSPIEAAPAVEVQATASEKPPATAAPFVTLGNLRLDARLKTAPLPKAPPEQEFTIRAPSKPVPPVTLIRAEREEDDWQRAQLLLHDGRSDQAEPLLRRALLNQPGNVSARQALIGILLPSRRHAEAAELMRLGLAQSPEQTAWAMNLGRLYVDKNDYAAAWEVLAKSATHAQQNAEYLAFCGTVLQRLNRSADALPYYRNALQLKPREGRWWVGYGIALESDGKTTDARESYQRARSLGELPAEVMSFVEQKLR